MLIAAAISRAIPINRTAIVQAIDRGTFQYADHFPNSRRAKLFGEFASRATLKDKADVYLVDVAPI